MYIEPDAKTTGCEDEKHIQDNSLCSPQGEMQPYLKVQMKIC